MQPALAPPPPRSEAELARLEVENAQLRTASERAARLEDECARLKAAAEEKAARLDDERARLEAAAEKAARLEGEVTKLRTIASNAGRQEAEIAELRRAADVARAMASERIELREQVRRREAELLEAHTTLEASDKRADAATRRLEEDLTKLRAALSKESQAHQAEVARLHERERERAREHEDLAAEKVSLQKQQDALTRDKSRLEGEVARLGAKLGGMATELDELRDRLEAREQALSETTAKAQERAEQLEDALAKAKVKTTELENTRRWEKGSEAEAEKERSRLEEDLRGAEGALREAKAQVAALEPKARDVERIMAENSALRVELAELERQLQAGSEADLSTFQRRGAELSLREKALEARAAELEHHIEENHSLKQRAMALEAVTAENERLLRRLRDLEAQAFAAKPTPHVRTLPPAPLTDPTSTRAEKLEGILATLVHDYERCQVAVLSDVRGLLIASSGDRTHQTELAAAASLAAYTTDKIRELLPMTNPKALQWIDENRVSLRSSWLHTGVESLLLTTLNTDIEDHDAPELLKAAIAQLVGEYQR